MAELGPGDLFGEMTCMSLYPRSATVQAATDCTMYEMLRNVLDIMQRNKSLKAQLEAIENKVSAYLEELDQTDAQEASSAAGSQQQRLSAAE